MHLIAFQQQSKAFRRIYLQSNNDLKKKQKLCIHPE